MKILAVSLLRMGDILMQNSIFMGIRQSHPGAEIHLLVHEEFAQAKQLLDGIDYFHFVPYRSIQSVLVEGTGSLSSAFNKLAGLVRFLNEQKYDMIYNCTHTLLSARIMDLLKSPQKKGIQFDDGRVFRSQEKWLNYMNEIYTQTGLKPFHMIEVLSRAVGVECFKGELQRSTVKNEIYIQTETSDVKKNWPLQHFKNLKKEIESRFKDQRVYLVIPPHRKEVYLEQFNEVDLVACSLSEAKQRLSGARLLISPDTSMIHLAAMVGCPSVVLFLGSANVTSTFPLQEGSILLSPKTECYPCRHSEACKFAEPVCHEDLLLKDVISAIEFKLEENKQSFAGTNVFQVTGRTDRKFYNLQALTGGSAVSNSLERKLSQQVWEIYLNEDYRQPLPPYGSTAQEFIEDFGEINVEQEFLDGWLQRELQSAAMLESFVEKFQHQMQEVSRLCHRPNFDGVEGIVNNLSHLQNEITIKMPSRSDELGKLRDLVRTRYESAFSFYKAMKLAVEEFESLNFIRSQIISKALAYLRERRASHVKRARKLSSVST